MFHDNNPSPTALKSVYVCAQDGRSLVEMLGTLAIMGVLSALGVWGFNVAMDRHRANEIVHSVSKMSVMAASQFLTNNTFSLNDFNHQTDNGYAVSELNYGKEPIFGIRVPDLPKSICQRIMTMGWNKPKEIAINGVAATDGSDCTDSATMDFIFLKDLEGTDYQVERCDTGHPCSSDCDTCVDGVCQENCANGEECVYRPTGRQSATDKTMCCPADRVMNGICCASVRYDAGSGQKLCCPTTNTNNCCPENEFWGRDTANSNDVQHCYPCDTPQRVYAVAGLGNYSPSCPERVLDGWYSVLECVENDQIVRDGKCYCPDNKPIQNWNGYCYTCESRQRGIWSIATLFLRDSISAEVCRSALWCGDYYCNSGYVTACASGKIGISYHGGIFNFKLANGETPAIGCYDCSEVDIATIQLESQCHICGGTWNGDNWHAGTCTPAP